MSSVVRLCAVCLGAALAASHIQPMSAQSQGRGRGLGRANRGEPGPKAIRAEMPPEMGAKNGAEAIAALRAELGQKVGDRGGDPDHFAEILAADESLWIDSEGKAMFVDVVEHDGTEADGDPTTTDPVPPTGPPPTPIRLEANGLPVHHSKPSAQWTFYLDFDGATVLGGHGGWFFSGFRSTGPYSIDGDATFNTDEQSVISRTWVVWPRTGRRSMSTSRPNYRHSLTRVCCGR